MGPLTQHILFKSFCVLKDFGSFARYLDFGCKLFGNFILFTQFYLNPAIWQTCYMPLSIYHCYNLCKLHFFISFFSLWLNLADRLCGARRFALEYGKPQSSPSVSHCTLHTAHCTLHTVDSVTKVASHHTRRPCALV